MYKGHLPIAQINVWYSFDIDVREVRPDKENDLEQRPKSAK